MLRERVVTASGLLEIELNADMSFVLRFGELVEYACDRRRVRGRTLPYRFRSVEQLRYDFEQDVLAAGGRLAEGA